MPKAPIAPDVHQHLYCLSLVSSEIPLDIVRSLDRITKPNHLALVQVESLAFLRHAGLVAEFRCGAATDAKM